MIYPTDPPFSVPGELVTPRAFRVARAGYAAPLNTSPSNRRGEHRQRLSVALGAAAPLIVGDVLARWVSYLDDCTMAEAFTAYGIPPEDPRYHEHRAAVRAFEHAATVLDDHARRCTGRQVPPGEVPR